MNVIYTWVKMDENSHSSKGWGNNFIDMAMISVSAANQYHHTKLYCDSVSRDFFIKHKIPINEIIVLEELENFNSPNWGFAKLLAMKYETGKYVHIDFDTILTKSPIWKDYSIVFGFFELNFGVRSTPFREIEYLFHNYLRNYIRYHKNEENDETWDFKIIPNNSYMFVNDSDIIKNIIDKLYEFVQPIIGKNDDTINQYMEQYLFYKFLKDNKVKVGFQSALDDPNAIQIHHKKELIQDVNNLNKWIETPCGFFHWPTYNQYTTNEIYPLYKKLWDLIDIKHRMITPKPKALF